MKKLAAVVAVLGLAGAAVYAEMAASKGKTAQAAEPKVSATPSGAATTPKIKELYKTKCASCHAATGKGNAAMAKAFKVEPAALDLVDLTTKQKTDTELEKIINDGSGKMPAFKGKIPAAEVKELVAYIRSLAPAK